jgi:tryptophan-rich sensory protein
VVARSLVPTNLAELAVGGLPLAVGAIGSLTTMDGVRTWYPGLAKPPWTPPGGIFGPVWTTLYLMMGVALLQVWRRDRRRPEVQLALGAFAIQLALNGAWSWIFFGRRQIGLAFAEILVLHVAIVATIAAFARVSRPAAWLLVPYLAWVTFAAVLNGAIWRLND